MWTYVEVDIYADEGIQMFTSAKVLTFAYVKVLTFGHVDVRKCEWLPVDHHQGHTG
jgi:hypothetical protein